MPHTVIDFYDDTHGDVLRDIAVDRGSEAIPDFVRKCASAIPSAEFRAGAAAYAWPAQERFRIDTPADVWLSHEYFRKTASVIPFQYRPMIEDAIKCAAELHGVELHEPPTVKMAALEDGDFLVVVTLPADDPIIKRASTEQVEFLDNEQARFRAVRIDTPEAVKVACLTYPRGFEGSLAKERLKAASTLADLAQTHGFDPGPDVTRDNEPTKRSHLLGMINMRVGAIVDALARNEKAAGLAKAAADGGKPAPYEHEPGPTYDPRLKLAYQELAKMAYEDDIPSSFWGKFEALDKLAGFGVETMMTPAYLINRELDDDMPRTFVKIANENVYLPQLLAKMSAVQWHAMLPDVLEYLDSPRKMASLIEGADSLVQRGLLAVVKGY
jgi:hypothetical protein